MSLDYLSAKEAALKWDISARRVAYLCENGRVSGAIKKANVWLIPADAPKPPDGRVNNRRQPRK